MQIYLSSRLQSITINDVENVLNGEYNTPCMSSLSVPEIILDCMEPYVRSDNFRSIPPTPISRFSTEWFIGLILANLYYKISPQDLENKYNNMYYNSISRNSRLSDIPDEDRIYAVSAATLMILSNDIIESGEDFCTTDEIMAKIREYANSKNLKICELLNKLEINIMSLSECDLKRNLSIVTPDIIIDTKEEWRIPESARVIIENDEGSTTEINNHSLTEENTKYMNIRFRDLKDLHDGNVLVWMSLLMPESREEKDSTVKEMTEFFREHNLIGSKDEIVNICEIKGNVRESFGDHRVDQLIVFNEGCKINPGARLMFGSEIKWVSDFVVNSSKDYV